jgi:hypothetical protein
MSSQIKFVKKISTATLGFDPNTVRKACEKKPAALFRVYGLATGVKYGSGDNGPWTKFTGQFEASDRNEEIVRSGELFLPNMVTPILESQIISGKGEEGFKGIQFAMEIGSRLSDTPIGYEYTTRDLLPSDTSKDFLAGMRAEHAMKAIAK